jgi:hypothetical protein
MTTSPDGVSRFGPEPMIEIGWSNFVLGLLIGYLFWNPQASGPQLAAAPSEPA